MKILQNAINPYYEDVLQNDYTKMYQRHPQFPEIVMTCAIDDYRYDVIEALLRNKISVKYKPHFKFEWVQDKTALLGISPKNLETEEELERKFKMIDFLQTKGVMGEDVIPKHMIAEWREFKGIKIGEKKNTLLYFVLIMISVCLSICLPFVL